MASPFESFVLVEIDTEAVRQHGNQSIRQMIRTYTDKARGEDALSLLREVCKTREFDLIPVEHVD